MRANIEQTEDEVSGNTVDFVNILLLTETYKCLSRIASNKRLTVPQVIADALARYIEAESSNDS